MFGSKHCGLFRKDRFILELFLGYVFNEVDLNRSETYIWRNEWW